MMELSHWLRITVKTEYLRMRSTAQHSTALNLKLHRLLCLLNCVLGYFLLTRVAERILFTL